MSSQGPRAPGGSTTFGSGSSWSNVGNIAVDDGASFASSIITVAAGSQTVNLEGNTYGFSVPLNATMLGVVFTYKGKLSSGVSGDVQDGVIQLGNGNTPIGTGKSPNNLLTTSLTQFSFGASNDLWGVSLATLTPAFVNSGSFSVIADWQLLIASSRTVNIDAYRVTVYYSVPPIKFFFMGGLDQ